jgi:hypothetical protein
MIEPILLKCLNIEELVIPEYNNNEKAKGVEYSIMK